MKKRKEIKSTMWRSNQNVKLTATTIFPPLKKRKKWKQQMGNWPSAYFISLLPTRKPQSSSICEALKEGGDHSFKKKRKKREPARS